MHLLLVDLGLKTNHHTTQGTYNIKIINLIMSHGFQPEFQPDTTQMLKRLELSSFE